MNPMIANKKIIVTGASSGMGERFVWHIAANGGIPIMIARSFDKLQAIQLKIKETFQQDAFIYQADLLKTEQVEAVFTQILAEHVLIDALINNAGLGKFAPVQQMEWADVSQMFGLNVFASMRSIQYMLPHFAQNHTGHIINIASQAGKIATPKSAAYTASKHALLGFTNVLRQEAKALGVRVTAVNVGPARTRFFDIADPEGSYVRSVERYMLDPDMVAKKVVGALFTNKREVNLPWWMELGSKLYQLIPGIMEIVLKQQFHKK